MKITLGTLLALALAMPLALLAQVTTTPSVTGVPAPQSAVAITGGTIDGTPIGATTPAAGSFTTLTASSTGVFSGTVNVPGLTLTGTTAIVPASSQGTLYASVTEGGVLRGSGSSSDFALKNQSGTTILSGTGSTVTANTLTVSTGVLTAVGGTFSGSVQATGFVGTTDTTSNLASTTTGAGFLTLGPAVPSVDGTGAITFRNTSANRNWRVGHNQITAGDFEITPSTANGGVTFSTAAVTIAGATSAITFAGIGTFQSTVNMPNLTLTSAAQTGTVCWTTGTGALTVDTTTTCLLSSERYKEQARPLTDGLSTILALRPQSYRLKAEYNPTGLDEQIGLMAEQVALVEPRLVALDADGRPRAVRYQQTVPVLVRAVQELHERIERLEVR